MRKGDSYGIAKDEKGETRTDPETLPLTAVPDLHGKVGLRINQAELGQFALYYEIGWQLIASNRPAWLLSRPKTADSAPLCEEEAILPIPPKLTSNTRLAAESRT